MIIKSALDSCYTEGEAFVIHNINSATAHRLYMQRRNYYRQNLGLLSNTDKNENIGNLTKGESRADPLLDKQEVFI